METPDAGYENLKVRTKQFALRVIRVVTALPNTLVAREIGRQLLRAGTSVGANYRAACRARSRADFISKMGVVEEEADEASFWMDLLAEAGIMRRAKLIGLIREADELVAIMVQSVKTARGGKR